MADPISHEEKAKWMDELLKTQEEISAQRCGRLVNKKVKVLVEEKTSKGLLSGRTDGNFIVEFSGDESLIGEYKTVEITRAGNYILKGKLI